MPADEVMHKWKTGKLHSGSKTGPVVKNQKQAVAIMESEKRAGLAKGGPVFTPGGHKGKLHRELGIPEGEKIGKPHLAEAAHSKNPEVARDAKRAQTMGKWKKR